MTGEAGLRLCCLADLERTSACGVELGAGAELRRIVGVRDGAGVVRAYENRCPHFGTPLEILPHRFLDEARTHLVCTTHGARFRIADGRCVWGPCTGDLLAPVAVRVVEGAVHLV